MRQNDGSDAETMRLKTTSGFGRTLTLNLIVWAGSGLLAAALGLSGLAEAAHGLIAVMSWLLLIIGILLAVAASALVAVSRREGRAATLGPRGIQLSGARRQVIAWNSVESCEIRKARNGGRLLFVRFTPEQARTAGAEGVYLGGLPEDENAEHEVVRRIGAWIAEASGQGNGN